MTKTEITDAAQKAELLRKTRLDIVLAGQTGDSFQHAHGAKDSVMVLSIGEEVTVWLLEDAPREEREAHTRYVRKVLIQHGGTTDDF